MCSLIMTLFESVWDYPRPPKLEEFDGHVRVVHDNVVIADSNRVLRMLETSHPPTYYIPFDHIEMTLFKESDRRSFCEFKGRASYYDLNMNGLVTDVGWYYPNPNFRYSKLKDHIAIYSSKVDQCLVNDEQVKAQEGDFYGGWITNNIQGPFKGGTGTHGW